MNIVLYFLRNFLVFAFFCSLMVLTLDPVRDFLTPDLVRSFVLTFNIFTLDPLKALGSMVLMFLPMMTVVAAEDESKAPVFIVVTLYTYPPMVTVAGMVTVFAADEAGFVNATFLVAPMTSRTVKVPLSVEITSPAL